MKKFWYILIIIVIVVAGYWFFTRSSEPKADVVGQSETNDSKPEVTNLTYDVDGDIFTLKNGTAEKESLPGSVIMDSLTILGDTAYGDLDGDGDTDAAVWLLNDPGGTGKFHYAALVINNRGTFEPTNTIFLGDRIEPKKLAIQAEIASYSFLARKDDDPMTAEPTVAKSVRINYDKIKNRISIKK